MDAALDPAPYRPRVARRRQTRLLREFVERVGDPEKGGSSSRERLTSYRQDALRCAQQLAGGAVRKASDVRAGAGVVRAGDILRHNHYGWFERVKLGHYSLTPKGEEGLTRWAPALAALQAQTESTE